MKAFVDLISVNTGYEGSLWVVRVAWDFLLLSNSVVTLIGGEDDAGEPRSGPKPRKIRKLSWERSKLRNIKAKLEEAYLARLTEKQRHTSAPVSRTEEESSLPHPTNGPRWAVRSG